MSLIDTPMNTVRLAHTSIVQLLIYYHSQAHHHAANADDYLIKGLIVLAAEEHLKAAEAYMAAIDRSHDESVQHVYNLYPLKLIIR